MPIRDTLKLIYRSLMMLVTAAFGIGSIAAFWYATPGNGLMLVGGILAVLTLMAGLSIFRLDWADAEAEAYREIIDDIREKSPVTLRFGDQGQLQWSLKQGAPLSVRVAEPEVHRVDSATLEDAKRMAADGAPIDDICRSVDPGHDTHDPVHQEAFRKIVRAMIEQG